MSTVAEVKRRLPEIIGLRRDTPELIVRMGIATGEAVVGTIGSPNVYDTVSARLRALPNYALDLRPAEGRGWISVALALPSAPEGAAAQTRMPTPIARAPRPQYEIILDASGSMVERTHDGQRKIDAAKAAISTIVSGLPEDAPVALRVYGHRLPDRPTARSCTDIELVAPMRPGNREAILRAVKGIRPRGETPIGASLRLAAKDFIGTEGHRSIILVTDGDESRATKSSDADFPDRVVQDLRTAGLDVSVSIVGLNVTEAHERDRLQQLAATGGGSYHDAASATELVAAMPRSLSMSV